MKKKMESIDDPLFDRLTEEDARHAVVGAITLHVTAVGTNDPNPDYTFDSA